MLTEMHVVDSDDSNVIVKIASSTQCCAMLCDIMIESCPQEALTLAHCLA